MFSRIIARLLGRGAPTDAEIERELRDHLELDAEELAADNSIGTANARFAARRRFGNVSNARDAVRDVWHWSWIEQMEQDVRHGLRAIRRSPVYGAAVTLTLAMGIGAGTTAYTISRAVHDPFPALAQDRLLWIAEHNAPCGVDCTELSPAAFVALQQRAPSMHVIGTYSMRAALRGPSGSEMTSGFAVSPETWSVIGARFAAGHGFPADAGSAGAPRFAVLSYDFWNSRFNASRGVIDSVITLDGQPYTVTGVLAKGLVFPTAGDFYAPFQLSAASTNDHASRFLTVFGRLTDGATLERAAAEASTITGQLAHDSPATDSGWVVRARPIAEFHTDDLSVITRIADVAALLVFLAACMSAANLALARLSSRRRELALRAALGVRQWRLARHLLTEALLLSIGAGTLGAALALWGVRAMRQAIPADFAAFVPGWAAMRLDPHVLLFAFGAAVLSMLAFALIPVLRATRLDLSQVLSDGGRGHVGGMHGTRSRAALIVLEVSIALVLLTAATLFTRSVRNMITGDPGVRLDHVLVMNLTLPPHESDSARVDFYRRLEANFHDAPGFRGAGVGTTTPLSNNYSGIEFDVPGYIRSARDRKLNGIAQNVTPGYIETTGVSIETGRGIDAHDVAGSQHVVVINRYMADALWPRVNPIGRVITIGDSSWTVVGVAANVHHGGLDEEMRYTLYRPLYQVPRDYGVLAVWTNGDPASMSAAARAIVARTDPAVAVGDIMTMQAMQARHVSPFTMMAGMMSVLAIVTLTIAIVGLYGLIAYGVAQRTREIGVRIALGALRTDILAQIGGGAVRLAAVGVAFGVIGAVLFARLLVAMLYGVSANDPRTYAVVSVMLLAIAGLAAAIPAWRAASVDPTVALRDET